jgi:hypothetical protein
LALISNLPKVVENFPVEFTNPEVYDNPCELTSLLSSHSFSLLSPPHLSPPHLSPPHLSPLTSHLLTSPSSHKYYNHHYQPHSCASETVIQGYHQLHTHPQQCNTQVHCFLGLVELKCCWVCVTMVHKKDEGKKERKKEKERIICQYLHFVVSRVLPLNSSFQYKVQLAVTCVLAWLMGMVTKANDTQTQENKRTACNIFLRLLKISLCSSKTKTIREKGRNFENCE